MKIIVCLKAVPDTNTSLKVGPDKRTINPSGVKAVMSPYDAVAVSKGIEVKEANPGSTVIAISCGKADGEFDAQKRIKDALALGADEGIFIPDAADHRDALGTAKALAAAIKAQAPYDLVLFGRQAVDTQSFAVGPMVAELLGIPFVMDAMTLEVEGGKAKIKRSAEGRVEHYELALPAALSAQRGLSEERYAKLKDIMKAKSKSVTRFEFSFPASSHEVLEMLPPPERKAGRIIGEGPGAAAELLRLLQVEAKALSF